MIEWVIMVATAFTQPVLCDTCKKFNTFRECAIYVQPWNEISPIQTKHFYCVPKYRYKFGG